MKPIDLGVWGKNHHSLFPSDEKLAMLITDTEYGEDGLHPAWDTFRDKNNAAYRLGDVIYDAVRKEFRR